MTLRSEVLKSERLQAFVEEEFEELERGRLQAQVDEETKRRTAAESLSEQGEFGDEKLKTRQETLNHTGSIKQGKPHALDTEVITETKFPTGRLAWLARLQQKAEGVPVSRPLHKSSSEPGGAPTPGHLEIHESTYLRETGGHPPTRAPATPRPMSAQPPEGQTQKTRAQIGPVSLISKHRGHQPLPTLQPSPAPCHCST